MWVWQGSRVNSWLAGCLAGGWLMWCCCLVVEAGSWCWFGAAVWWWKLEADADFSQCPKFSQYKYPMVLQCQNVHSIRSPLIVSFCVILYSLCNSPGSLGGCRGVCSPCSLLILLIFTEFADLLVAPSLGNGVEFSGYGVDTTYGKFSGYGVDTFCSKRVNLRSQYGWHYSNVFQDEILDFYQFKCNFMDFNHQEKGWYVFSLLFTGCWDCI